MLTLGHLIAEEIPAGCFQLGPFYHAKTIYNTYPHTIPICAFVVELACYQYTVMSRERERERKKTTYNNKKAKKNSIKAYILIWNSDQHIIKYIDVSHIAPMEHHHFCWLIMESLFFLVEIPMAMMKVKPLQPTNQSLNLTPPSF